ncbi:MAG TPA: hypothetical protein VGS04_05320, partial [Nitrososphaerales archaeon]|nr:hypothetical protein [Nitrososphaerales archaeon]
MQRELSQFSQTRELPASQLKRGVFLFRGELKARVEPDGSTSWVHSSTAKKLLFGREIVEVFKIQSGVKIAVKPPDALVRATPTEVSHVPRGPDRVQAVHSVRLVTGNCTGSARSVRVTNRGDAMVKLRILTLHDPTSLNFRRERDPSGEIGVNAFNRHDQVVMDDVGDTTGVRVISFSPRPSIIYMTKDKSRAAELLALGELPESSLGMSGSVILLTQHDFDLPPGATAEVRSLSVYHPSSLEAALSAAASRPAEQGEDSPELRGVGFASSSTSMNFCFEWAKAALYAIESEGNFAERLWCGVALSLVRGDYFEKMMESMKLSARKEGAVRYSEATTTGEHAERAGPVETSLYLLSACAFFSARAGDKRLIKKWYPHLKRVADGLAGMLGDGLVTSPPDSPDGWRRRLGAGFPTGHTAEVNLIAARGLRDASTLAYLAGRGSDSAKFKELSVRLLNVLSEKLRDSESGVLALNVDGRGVIHREITADQAVGLSFCSPDQNLASSVVHRLLESDFETGYGPRTVAGSNNLYFSPSYGEGQLGGYWTRAATSHAILAYLTGYPSIGSAQLEKVARLVHLDVERLGGIPGEIPYWIDTERRQVVGSGSDPVAASRFIEAVVFGEAGLSLGSQGPKFQVTEASQLKWLFLHGLDLGRRGSIFVGRSAGRTAVVSTFGRDTLGDSSRTTLRNVATAYSHFAECERISGQTGLEGLSFWDSNSSLLCFGNPSSSGFSGGISVAMRPKSFSTALFAQVEEFRQETGLWSAVERVKLLNRFETKVELRPNS